MVTEDKRRTDQEAMRLVQSKMKKYKNKSPVKGAGGRSDLMDGEGNGNAAALLPQVRRAVEQPPLSHSAPLRQAD